MKKLFLPIVLLSACYAYANQDAVAQPVELTEEQKVAQAIILQSAQDIYNVILQNPTIRESWEGLSDTKKGEFEVACIKFAELRYVIANQYAPHFTSVFETLTDLTGNGSWRADVPFFSEGYIAQAQQNAKNQNSESEDFLDEDFDDKN